MGLPKINIQFKELGVSSIQRSGRGVVALLLKGNAKTGEYRRLDQVDKDDFTAENYKYVSHVFQGGVSKVIIESGDAANFDESLQKLRNNRFNYLAMPDADDTEAGELVSFIKSARQDNKTFKLVTANQTADSELVINFTADDITVDGSEFTPMEYTARVAGVLAGLPLNRSATYFVLPEVESIKSKANPDEAINNGELILVDDGEKIKFGRAVNSFTSTDDVKGEAYKKIKIVEGLHLFEEDVRSTFEDSYVGKYVNDYDNKVLFTTAINAYVEELEREYVLDRAANNNVKVDVDAQRLFIEGKGLSTDDMSEQEIKEYNTGSGVFLRGNLKFVDAMEDLDFVINI